MFLFCFVLLCFAVALHWSRLLSRRPCLSHVQENHPEMWKDPSCISCHFAETACQTFPLVFHKDVPTKDDATLLCLSQCLALMVSSKVVKSKVTCDCLNLSGVDYSRGHITVTNPLKEEQFSITRVKCMLFVILFSKHIFICCMV